MTSILLPTDIGTIRIEIVIENALPSLGYDALFFTRANVWMMTRHFHNAFKEARGNGTKIKKLYDETPKMNAMPTKKALPTLCLATLNLVHE